MSSFQINASKHDKGLCKALLDCSRGQIDKNCFEAQKGKNFESIFVCEDKKQKMGESYEVDETTNLKNESVKSPARVEPPLWHKIRDVRKHFLCIGGISQSALIK